jgi:hypothetical protein
VAQDAPAAHWASPVGGGPGWGPLPVGRFPYGDPTAPGVMHNVGWPPPRHHDHCRARSVLCGVDVNRVECDSRGREVWGKP